MRILLLTEGLPPAVNGGYEQLCEEVAEHLACQGHSVHVLTGAGGILSTPNITRSLALEIDEQRGSMPRQFWLGRLCREQHNVNELDKVIARFHPDLLYIWNARNLPRRLLWHAEKLDLPVIYYLAGYWPTLPDMFTSYWQTPAAHPLKRLPKRVIAWLALRVLKMEGKPYPLRFACLHCVSQAVLDTVRKAGIRPTHARVIYNGIDLRRFTASDCKKPCSGAPLRLLYAGRLTRDKGVDTVVAALLALKKQNRVLPVTLTLAGDGPVDFVAQLQRQVDTHALNSLVTFRSSVPRERMPALLCGFDVLLFPSRDEAMPRIVQEAMATGLVVVGTTAGGTKELLQEGETGLTFDVDDGVALACQIQRLVDDRSLYQSLARRGQLAVQTRFNIQRMIDEIEADLAQCLRQG